MRSKPKRLTSRCPYCDCLIGYFANPTKEQTPHEGDFSVCLGCASILVYGADLLLHKPSEIDLGVIANDQAATEEVHRRQIIVWAAKHIQAGIA